TVAQAYHWFKFDAFEKEVKRVAKKDAVIAVWGYGLFSTNDVAVDALIKKFYTQIVGPYWDVERKHIDDRFSCVPFNFTPLPKRDFFINIEWSKDELIGYLNSWSAVQHFINDKKYNPVDDIISDLDLLWKDVQSVSFPVFLRIARVE
ncbi:MAG: SAM-dependent methyltransferase, partial [Ginsengibacter sp.]